MSDLQLAVDAQENASPEKAKEWRTYLFSSGSTPRPRARSPLSSTG